VAAAAARLTPPTEVPLKDPKDWKLAGKRLARLDTVDKTTGAQVYGADLKLPGMLNAAIKACPVFGGKVKGYDAAKVLAMPGVKKVVTRSTATRWPWWPTPGGAPSARSTRCPSTGTWASTPRPASAAFDAVLKAGLDAPEAVVGNRRRRQGRAGRRRAHDRARSTPTRTRTTPRWSR
jgi:isoquinoline 1-oxidoreductase beta subunit